MLEIVRSRLAAHPWHTIELAVTVLLWQASTGVFLLSIVQQYLPDQLEANAAFPGYALAAYAAARFLLQAPAGWLAAKPADKKSRRRPKPPRPARGPSVSPAISSLEGSFFLRHFWILCPDVPDRSCSW